MRFRKQFVESNGTPVSGGRLYCGPGNAFMDAGYAVPCTEPIILDSQGRTEFHAFSEPAMTLKNVLGKDCLLTDDYERIFVECAE